VIQNPLRARLAAGATLQGIIVFTASPMIVELAAAAGLDFVILDMEHSALDIAGAAHLVRAADASGITPFVRVPGADRGLITRLLDLGAAGIVLPHASEESCAALLQAMRYAPEGSRGACQITRAAGYRRGDWDSYATRANREVMAVALIEDAATLTDIESVARMPGIDVCFVGPTDLSVALGVPGATFDHPALGAALDKVVDATRRHGKFAMTLLGNRLDSAYGARLAERGVQMIVLGTDADLFTHSLRELAIAREQKKG
jgi:2-keto-3-deoxy-L-rhamnonate aldolase RhmA